MRTEFDMTMGAIAAILLDYAAVAFVIGLLVLDRWLGIRRGITLDTPGRDCRSDCGRMVGRFPAEQSPGSRRLGANEHHTTGPSGCIRPEERTLILLSLKAVASLE